MEKEIVAIDITIPANTPVESDGTAYYRLTPEMKKFFEMCEEKHGILGFSWDVGSFNFGVIIKAKKEDDKETN